MQKSEIHELDDIWSRLVKDKAKWTCEHCGIRGVRMEAAHVVGRRHRATRWGCLIKRNGSLCSMHRDADPNCEICKSKIEFYDLAGHCLCHNCHQQYDEHGPREGSIIIRTIGEDRKAALQVMAHQVVARNQSFEEIKLTLEQLGGY